MRTVAVIVIDVLGQHRAQMPAAHDEHPVEQFPSDAAHPSLRVGVAWGACGGVRSASIPSAAKTVSNAAVNFASRSRSRNRPARSPRSSSRLRARWVTHAPTGCDVTPSRCTRRVATSMTNKTYKRWKNTVSTVRSPWPHALGLGAEELPPGDGRPRRRRIHPGAPQDGPDRAGAEFAPESAQLAVDATVAPGRVLPGQSQYQRAEFGRHGRSTTTARVGPPAPDQVPAPPRQRRRLHQPPTPHPAWQHPDQPSQHRPVGPEPAEGSGSLRVSVMPGAP